MSLLKKQTTITIMIHTYDEGVGMDEDDFKELISDTNDEFYNRVLLV